ncbi:MAG: apolipoprotein N-acyltransferase [Actinomycetales bacterium]|nr:apolipoprotein N-acyltransferase [Actinomycetales bacterium]
MNLVFRLNRDRKTFRALLAGLALAFGFAHNWWPIAVLAIAWLYRLLTWQSFKQRLLTVSMFGLAFFGAHLWWMKALGIDAWILITLLCIFSFSVIAIAPIHRGSRLSKFEFAGLWLLAELIRGSVPWGGFKWGFIAYTTAGSSISYLGRIGGTALITLVLVLIATAVAEIFQGKVIRRTVLILSTLFLASLLSSGSTTQSIRVGIVQGGEVAHSISEYQRPDAVLQQQIALTRANSDRLAQTDLVIWPENSVNLISTEDNNSRLIQEIVNQVNKPFLIGAVLEPIGAAPQNVALLWVPQNGVQQIYVKQHLVPFGEYLPLRNLLASKIGRFDQIPRDFRSGSGGGLIELNGTKLGVAICFEVADQAHLSDLARSGGEILLGLSNSSTYLGTSQPGQQFQISRFSTAIHNRAMAVVTTTGVSGVIDSDGRVIAVTNSPRSTVMTIDLPRVSAVTFADRHQLGLHYMIIFLIALLLINRVRRSLQEGMEHRIYAASKVGE